jgi:hypothetical protein
MMLQEWIYHLEEGAGARIVKVAAVSLGFIAFACLYDLPAFQGFTGEEAMETAQVARNLSEGHGFVTKSIRPLTIYLLQQAGGAGQGAAPVALPVPDLNNPPVYPLLLAAVMKVLPFSFTASQYWFYQPERWIAMVNQLIFFAAVLLLFRIARRLFDGRVAWVSAIVFAATNLFWKFSVSGLSTLLLLLVFLAVVWCLIGIEERERAGSAGGAVLGLALLAGALVGIGGMTRYAFGWMIVPVVLFVAWVAPRARARLCLALLAAFLVVMSPWLARNFAVSKACFGEAGYALVQGTPPLEGDRLERSLDPGNDLKRVSPLDVMGKFFSNARAIWWDDLPRFGGNWVSAFFLVGLLIPFRNPALGRVRLFLVFSLLLLFVVQALGQTHLSADWPEINSENLLVLLAPLVFVYGVGLFFILLDQLDMLILHERRAVVGGFIVVMSVPFVMSSLLLAHGPAFNSIYSPLHIQRTAQMMGPQELMMSDIPGAVAWYGDRNCAWLTLDDNQEFLKLNNLAQVKGVLLTQRTTDKRFLSEMILEPSSWSQFVMECQAHRAVPSGFPLTKAPAGYLPHQMFLSDQERGRTPP